MATQRPIGFWLKLVDELISAQFAATLEEHGITRRQWHLLSALQSSPAPLPELDAAVQAFVTDDESSEEHLSELVESEWVRIDADVYMLTDRGGVAVGRLLGVVQRHRNEMATGITDAEYDATLDVLERMARNLGWAG